MEYRLEQRQDMDRRKRRLWKEIKPRQIRGLTQRPPCRDMIQQFTFNPATR
jgi:hypothetical protein